MQYERKEGKRDGVRVSLLSLGCPKNLIDSESILGRLGREGYTVTGNPEDADVIVVNTCGFIEDAKEESIRTILEACELKRSSQEPKRVVVTGCLAQRYGEELRREIPELDAVVGFAGYENLPSLLSSVLSGKQRRILALSDPDLACHAEVGRFRLTPPHYAYLRISEGCDNPCTFCAIPLIRGRFRSKPLEEIRAEAEELVASGTEELVLVSQDTTSYGIDLYGRYELRRLLETLSDIAGVRWIRVLYAYPAFLNDETIDALANLDKVVPYLDMPLQHISDRMLRRMGRRMDERKTRALLAKLRERVPGLYLRTTFLVGFPGETEEDHRTLLSFVQEARFERLGVFTYSQEEGTPAAAFPDPVPEDVARRRMEEVMLAQQEVAFALNAARIGEVTEVVIDSDEEAALAEDLPGVPARSYGEAPEVDPLIYVASRDEAACATEQPDPRRSFVPLDTLRGPLRAGDVVQVRITASRHYDLLARPASRPARPRGPSSRSRGAAL